MKKWIWREFPELKKEEFEQINNAFKHMVYRCYNKKMKEYKEYGARGISVCREWLEDKRRFIQWSISEGGYKYGLSIDRIDSNGNYEPNNCQWIPWRENCGKTRNTIFIEVDGEKHSMTQWSKILGCYIGAIRIYYNQHGLDATINRIRQLKKIEGKPLKRGELLTVFGIPAVALQWERYLSKCPHYYEKRVRERGLQATIEKIETDLRAKISKEMGITLKEFAPKPIKAKQKDETPRKRLPLQKECEHCHKMFRPKNANQKYCGYKCMHEAQRKVPKPSLEEIMQTLERLNNNYCAVGRYYGVTDNAVRKWIKSYK